MAPHGQSANAPAGVHCPAWQSRASLTQLSNRIIDKIHEKKKTILKKQTNKTTTPKPKAVSEWNLKYMRKFTISLTKKHK